MRAAYVAPVAHPAAKEPTDGARVEAVEVRPGRVDEPVVQGPQLPPAPRHHHRVAGRQVPLAALPSVH